MRRRLWTICGLIGGLAVGAIAANAVGAEPAAEDLAFFEQKIRPVLVNHCYECHSSKAKQIKGGLVLDTRAGMLRGGETGPAVTPNSVDDSLILEALRYESLEMPPKEQLPESVAADFESWILRGAPDPREGGEAAVQNEIDFVKAREFWAFQPPRASAPPEVKRAEWPRSDVDRHVLARLESAGIEPVADADASPLLRRVYFDLTGLPPSLEQLQSPPDSPAALEALVDRLLASPQFGERWGRHWLDVARYAESNGRDRNFLFTQAWRYRDYVIQSFNDDKPFDQFVREQVAGDLLPFDSAGQRNSQLIATGFLAIGPKSLNERDKAVFSMDVVDEQIDVTTRAVMALTVSCARCHDHKFDPIPTAEYYSLAGIFRSTNTFYGTSGRGNRQPSKLLPLQAESKQNSGGRSQAPSARDEKSEPAQLEQQARLEQRAEYVEKIRELSARLKGAKGKKGRRKIQQELKRVQAALRDLNNSGGNSGSEAGESGPAGFVAMGVADGAIGNCRICIRGEPDNQGDEVPRQYLTILSSGARPQAGAGSGRLDLARWLTDRQNPLTARVIVNRVWQHLFGAGLVATVDNFGATGERPTHPELLDALAVEFMDDGWSVKRLIKRLVMTRTYQLGSHFEKSAHDIDPRNQLLWRHPQRRLEAEALRDAMLAASGKLQVTPPAGSPVTKLGDNKAVGRGVNLDGVDAESSHRSVYLPILRNSVPPSLAVFDFAEPSMVVGRRDATTVPAQALYLLNSEFIMDQSTAMAARALQAPDPVATAYLLALSRLPNDTERARADQFLADAAAAASANNNNNNNNNNTNNNDAARRQTWSLFCQALLACAEFRYTP